jgi:D-alanine-D-alanine ligase
MDKLATKHAWEAAGLPTPRYRVIRRGEPVGEIADACVVKAISSGSSIDVYVCKATPEASPVGAREAIDRVLARHDRVLVEQFISGPELTIGLLEEQPLAPIRIVPKSEFFDYHAKYKANDTEHRFDTGLPGEVVEKCRELVRKANAVVGAVDLARIDVMLDEKHNPYLLEINTLPGFTPKSLLPEAAAHAGVPFAALVDRLVKRAKGRGARRT